MPVGVFNTTLNPTNLNKRSFIGAMVNKYPAGSAPLFALTALNGSNESAVSTTHSYFSRTFTMASLTLAAAVGAGITLLDVGNTSNLLPGGVLNIPSTGENIRITSIASASTINVTRGFGRIVTAAIGAGALLVHAGNAFPENSGRPGARRLNVIEVPNYTQIFRDGWALSDTARASMTEIASFTNMGDSLRECGHFHSRNIETAMLVGQRALDITGTQPLRATQGVMDAIRQYAPLNETTAAATTTYEQLAAMMENAFEFSTDMGNPNERVAFCGSVASRVLHAIGRKYGIVEIMQKETSFGMQFTSINTNKGTVHFKEHPLFKELGLANTMVLLDASAVSLAYLGNRKGLMEQYDRNGKITENGTDGVGGSITTEAAVMLTNPGGCAIINGLTAAA